MVQNNKCKQAKKKLPNEKCADMEKNCTDEAMHKKIKGRIGHKISSLTYTLSEYGTTVTGKMYFRDWNVYTG